MKSKVLVTHIFRKLNYCYFRNHLLAILHLIISSEPQKRGERDDISRCVANFSIFSLPENFDTSTNYWYCRFIGTAAHRYNYIMPMIVILFTLLRGQAIYFERNTWRVFAFRLAVPDCPVPFFTRYQSPVRSMSSIICSRSIAIKSRHREMNTLGRLDLFYC